MPTPDMAGEGREESLAGEKPVRNQAQTAEGHGEECYKGMISLKIKMLENVGVCVDLFIIREF